jgi:hypothetical protein
MVLSLGGFLPFHTMSLPFAKFIFCVTPSNSPTFTSAFTVLKAAKIRGAELRY